MLPPGAELERGALLVDRASVVTLRTRCGCERTFVHRDASMLSREWVVPLRPTSPPAGIADPWPPKNEAAPIPRRTFRLQSIERDAYSPFSHYIYEEIETP